MSDVTLDPQATVGDYQVSDRAALSHTFKFTATVVGVSLILGGGTQPGFLSEVILQFLAIGLLISTLWHMHTIPRPRGWASAIVFVTLLALLPILQLVPLPISLWSSLPQRSEIVETLNLVGKSPASTALSVSPDATVLAGLTLLVPLSVFQGTVLLNREQRRWLSLIIVSVGVLSALVGLAQILQGPTSKLRFYEFTNPTEAVGFFANRNHFAALMYATFLFAIVWLIELATLSRRGILKQWTGLATASNTLVLMGVVVLIVLVAEVMARSRAGLGLITLAMIGSVPLVLSTSIHGLRSFVAKLVLGIVVVAGILALQMGLMRIMTRFEADPLADARLPFARNTIEAAKAYSPFGSGLGTFVQVYPAFEKTEDLFPNTYANHAHNDYLELWLETGVIGMGLLAVFLFWLTVKFVAVWRRSAAPEERAHRHHSHHLRSSFQDLDQLLPRAAALALVLLLAHSAVDYPLRTTALSVLFAVCCALLIAAPEAPSRSARASEDEWKSHERQDRASSHLPTPHVPEPQRGTIHWPQTEPAAQELASSQTGGNWGRGIAWPEQWGQTPGAKKKEPTPDS